MRTKRFTVTRGAYYNTSDDRADSWYVEDLQSDVVDRRGPGFRTKKEAQERARELQRMHSAGLWIYDRDLDNARAVGKITVK